MSLHKDYPFLTINYDGYLHRHTRTVYPGRNQSRLPYTVKNIMISLRLCIMNRSIDSCHYQKMYLIETGALRIRLHIPVYCPITSTSTSATNDFGLICFTRVSLSSGRARDNVVPRSIPYIPGHDKVINQLIIRKL